MSCLEEIYIKISNLKSLPHRGFISSSMDKLINPSMTIDRTFLYLIDSFITGVKIDMLIMRYSPPTL